MAFTKNFLFADAVPAQQAVQYAQLAAQQQAAEDQAFNDRIRTGTQGRISQQNSDQQRMLSQSQMQNANAQRDLDRQLQDRGYASQQTVATIGAGGRLNPIDARLKAQQDADAAALSRQAMENFSRGSSYAEMLNNKDIPLGFKQTLMKSGDVVMGPDGVWRSRHSNPNPVEDINNIIAGRQTVPVPGTVVQPGRIFGSNPVQGAVVGSKIPAAMDTIPSRARMLQMGPPSQDFPSAPAGPSPFETPGFRVFRQSDFIPQPVQVAPVDQPWIPTGY